MTGPAVSIPTGGFNRSGGVKTLVLLANAMASRGWRVRMIAPDYAADSPFELAPSVRVTRLGTGPLSPMLRKALYYARLALSAAAGADLCLANFYPTVYCALVSKMLHPRARVIYFVQGDEGVSHGTLAEASPISRAFRSLLARWSYQLPVRVICVSDWLRTRIGRPESVVVSQGLDLETFRPVPGRFIPRNPVVVGTIGSTAEAKGYPVFLRAVELRPERGCLEILVAAHERVPLPDGVTASTVAPLSETQMAEFYNRCDIFVFPSLSEGFGLPPLEAMACGCAVVTTECGGVADFARHEVNCLMVRPGDSVGLARAIGRLYEDPTLRARLAEQGLKTAQELDRAGMISCFFEALSA
jgi:glycosyltransferase involved in cell wall biosynthesis